MAAAVKKRIAKQKSSQGARNELQRYLESDLEEDMVDPVKWWGVSSLLLLFREGVCPLIFSIVPCCRVPYPFATCT